MSPVDDLMDEWEERLQRGELITPEELCADHPEWIDEVRFQIQALAKVDDVFNTVRLFGDVSAVRDLVPPDQITLPCRYKILRVHASGGIGRVFLAHDTMLNRPVAIKFPKHSGMSEDQLARFQREALITGQLEHPGIVPIVAFETAPGAIPCYVMRFIKGETLEQAIQKECIESSSKTTPRSLSFEKRRHHLQSFLALCNIVAYAHQQGVIHRDIKPNNVMLGPFGETLLLDWGIAKRLFSTSEKDREQEDLDWMERKDLHSAQQLVSTKTGQALGTPAYASPEQLFGKETAGRVTCDIYSLGATLFYILHGKSPIEIMGWKPYLEICKKKHFAFAQLLAKKIPSGLKAICNKAMALDPGERYASVLELANDIDRFMAGEPISVQRDTLLARVGRTARKNPAFASASVVATALLVAGSFLATYFYQARAQEYSESNQKLKVALNQAERFNRLGLDSLELFSDTAFLEKFARHRKLEAEERRVLESVLGQYKEIAANQNSTSASLKVQAELHYRMGILLSALSEDDQAESHLQSAVHLQKSMRKDEDDGEYWAQSLLSLQGLAEAQQNRDDYQAALKNAEDGLQLLEKLNRDQIKPFLPTDPLVLQGRLESVIAYSQAHLKNWNLAAEGYRKSIETFELAIHSIPSNADEATEFLTSSHRYLSIVLGHLGGDDPILVEERVHSVNLSVEYGSKLHRLFPQSDGVAFELVESLVERFKVTQTSNLEAAFADLLRAEPVAANLVDRFPNEAEYQKSFQSILHSMATNGLKLMRLKETRTALEKLSKLPLNERDIDRAIAVLEELYEQSPSGEEDGLQLALFYFGKGNVLEKRGNLIDSRDHAERAQQLYDIELKRGPIAENYLRRNFDNWLLLLRIGYRSEDAKLAEASLQRAQELIAMLSEQNPETGRIASNKLRLEIEKSDKREQPRP